MVESVIPVDLTQLEEFTKPQYLADGVYARWDGYQIWLEVSNGICVTDQIALDRDTWRALGEWQRQLNEKLRGVQAGGEADDQES